MAVMKKFDFYLFRGLIRETEHWGSFIDQLESQSYVNSVTGVDLPGNGRYNRLKSDLSIKAMAHFAHSHIDQETERPKVILAVSLGAMVAIELLHHYASSYHCAFLMNTSVAGVSPIYQRLQLQSLKHFYEVIISPSLEEKEMNILELVSNVQEKRNNIHDLWVDIARKRPVSTTNAARQLLAASHYRLPKKKPPCPMFLMASKADRMVDYRCTEGLAKKWRLPVMYNEKAGHELALDDPDWVLEQIGSHLQNI